MIRTALSICAVIGALALGACEKRSADNLPEYYLHKWDGKHAEAKHDNAPAPGAKDKAPADGHKG